MCSTVGLAAMVRRRIEHAMCSPDLQTQTSASTTPSMTTLPTLSGNMFTRYCPMMVPYENPQKLLGKYGQQIAEWKAADEYDCSHQGLFALKRGGNQVYVANDTRCAHVCDRLTHSLLTHRGLFAEEFVCLVLLRKQARTDICNRSIARDIIPAIQGCPLGESSVVLCTGETLGYRPASWSTSNPGKL